MKAALDNLQLLLFTSASDAVYEPVLLGNAPGPISGKVVLQGL
jgi:hypothetical protein